MLLAGILMIIAQVTAINSAVAEEDVDITVSSKAFTESVILGEILKNLAAQTGANVRHRRELGGTQVLWQALLKGDIDAYVEYTGTITRELFAGSGLTTDQLPEQLTKMGIQISKPLGFNNTYALSMKEETAEKFNVSKISDLRHHPDFRMGFSDGFIARSDGWQSVRQAYHLPQTDVRGMQHNLAYLALDSGGIEVKDAYATDGEIEHYHLRVLQDDLGHFPEYNAVIVYRNDLAERHPGVVEMFKRLEGQISEAQMIRMNSQARLEKKTESDVARDFLQQNLNIQVAGTSSESILSQLYQRTLEHLYLVGVSLISAILISIPLGIAAFKYEKFGQIILAFTGIVQTLPSLAVFVFMTPLLGIGSAPAIAALFLYSLLPIVRNTYVGLKEVSPQLRESAQALGLPSAARLRLIEMPLAMRSILAGIKTAAVINIGTATLGALIGAGGYGEPIISGIRLDNMSLILQGAIPAAALALMTQGGFELLERWVVPKGIQR